MSVLLVLFVIAGGLIYLLCSILGELEGTYRGAFVCCLIIAVCERGVLSIGS